ncbi:unnamed protein product [Camellia sinensis]
MCLGFYTAQDGQVSLQLRKNGDDLIRSFYHNISPGIDIHQSLDDVLVAIWCIKNLPIVISISEIDHLFWTLYHM